MLRLRGDRWVAWEFKLADCWIGVYWETRKADYATSQGYVTEEFHAWICLVPCLPIHFVSASHYAAKWEG